MNINLNWKIRASQKVVRHALKNWWPEIGIAFTGRKDSSVMMHIIMATSKKIPDAIFIDHGLHFDESYKTIERLKNLWNLKIDYVADEQLLVRLNSGRKKEEKRIILQKLKIKTLKDTIKKKKWKAVFTAVRKDEHPSRSNEMYFSDRKDHTRVHPMLHWTEDDIWSYIKHENIPYNPLYDSGYRSIGAKIFTSKTSYSERSGRDQDKENIMERLRSLGYF